MALRDDILGVRFPKVSDPIKIPAWGREIHVRTLSEAEIRQCVRAGSDAAVVCIGVADPEGNRLFTDDDLGTLAEMPYGVIQQVARAITKHNHLGEDDETGKS